MTNLFSSILWGLKNDYTINHYYFISIDFSYKISKFKIKINVINGPVNPSNSLPSISSIVKIDNLTGTTLWAKELFYKKIN